MQLTILGSGTSVPHSERSSAGFWLETNGGAILLDCSASAIHQMARENLDWANLDAIWISHFHLDHVGGLLPFLFGTKYAPTTQKREKTLKIFGPKGLQNLIGKFDAANDYNILEQPFPLEFAEVEPLESFEILPDVKAVALDTPHTPESLAIHLRDEDDKTIVYSADTGFTKTLGAFGRAADLFILECSFVEKTPVETHLQLDEAIYLIRQAKPRRAMFTHFYPEWDAVDFQAAIEKFDAPCEILEARDGLIIEI